MFFYTREGGGGLYNLFRRPWHALLSIHLLTMNAFSYLGLSQEDMKSHYIVQHKMNMRTALEQSAYDLERRKELIDHMEHEENEDTDTLRQKQ